MRAMGMVFLSRSWEKDKASILKTFSHLRDSKVFVLGFFCCFHVSDNLHSPIASVLVVDTSGRNKSNSCKNCRISSICKIKGFFLLPFFRYFCVVLLCSFVL